MATKLDAVLRAKLDDLAALRGGPLNERALTALAAGLRDRTNLVVARAAEVASELEATTLEPDLLAAYGRLALDGVRRDPSCAGKIAIALALRGWGYDDRDFWRAAAAYRQPEPSWGPPVDTAARLRAESALALAHSGHSDTLLDLVPLLADPELDARLGVIQAIAATALPGAAPLLWHKLLVGDAEPEAYYEAFVALLILTPERALPFVATFLADDRPGVPEVAALALGESQREAALLYLQAALETADDPAVRRSIPLGIVLLRSEAGMAYLIELVREGTDLDAGAALKALEIVRHDERLWARAQAAYDARSRPAGGRR
jgi:hypothetical protein